MRDITLGITLYHDFTTRAFATGIPTVLAGSPVLSVLEENNATPITSGVSVSVDRASVVGLNEATIVATGGNGYEAGKSYSIYISTGTVGGVSVVGEVIGQFTVGQSAAAVDLANGTDGLGVIKADTANILTDTAEIGTAGAGLSNINLPNQTMDIVGNITGSLSGSVGSVTAGVTLAADAITSAKIADNAFLAVNFGADFLTSAKIADGAFVAANFAASSLNGKGDWNIGKTGYALTTADWNVGKTGYSLTTAPLTAAEVNTQCDLALSDINLDHFVGTASGIPALPAGTYLDLLQDDGVATYSRSTDSLQAIRDHAATVKSDTAAILTDTADIQPNYATSSALATVDSEVGVIDGIVDTILIDTAAMQPLVAKIPLSDGSVTWNATALASINTEVDGALDTAIPELGVATPATTPTMRTAVMLNYMALSNKMDSTATAEKIYNAAGTAIATSTLSDDATTAIKGKFS